MSHNSLGMCGGDDGARIRDLCRDRFQVAVKPASRTSGAAIRPFTTISLGASSPLRYRAALISPVEVTLAASGSVVRKADPFQISAHYEEDLPISEIIYMRGTIREHLEWNVFNGLCKHVENDLGELSDFLALSY